MARSGKSGTPSLKEPQAPLGTKREFVDIGQRAKGREAPKPKAKGKPQKSELTAEQIELRRKLERRELFADQRHAAQLMWQHDTTGRPGGVTLCGWTLIAGREVEVCRETAPDKAPRGYLKGVQKCDRGWICPVCTRAKAEAGRRRVNALLSRGRREGWQMVMVTLTARHDRDTPLDWLWSAMSKASDELRGNHAWKRQLNPDLVGSIRAVEATHGANGWHPHFHVILVFPREAAKDQAEAIARAEVLRVAWMAELAKVGLTGNEHAFDVQGAAAAGSYLAKWGLAEELTLGGAKTGRAGGRTPWQLLRDSREGDTEAGQLWLEFVGVIAGTHQLRMTPGLRVMVNEELERLDAEAPPREEPKAITLDRIDPEEWMETGRRRRVRIIEAAEARTRRQAEREVWAVRHGSETDRDLLDLVVIDDENDRPEVRPVHDEPELRLDAIRREKAAECRRRRDEASAAWAELGGLDPYEAVDNALPVSAV